MNLEELKAALGQVDQLTIKTIEGNIIPKHFHLTEAGLITRHFIDCGGTERVEKKINLQLWVADDTDHRLTPIKLKGILNMAAKKIGFTNLPIEVEYQQQTINKYALSFDGESFHLTSTMTECLAKDKCGVEEKVMQQEPQCTPGGGCC
jgi:hypothetical protein